MMHPWSVGDVLWVVFLVGGFLMVMHMAAMQRRANARAGMLAERRSERPLWRRVALWIALWW
jgi:hypothetical protein